MKDATRERDELRARLREAGILNGHADHADPWEEVVLPLSMIQVDTTYQRDTSQSLIRSIVERYDPILMHPPDVNWREDGAFYVMDGQHRVRALLEKFGEDAQATCRLFYGLTREQEATIFGGQDNRKPLTPIERFRGGLRAEREPYVTINAITRSAGWTIALYYDDTQRGYAGIQAVGALDSIFRHYRDGHLFLTLDVLRECFGTEFPPPSHLLLGFAQFLAWYERDYDRKHLVKRMREVGLTGMRMEAEKRRLLDRVTSREATGMAIVMFYNLRRQPEHRLQAWETVLLTRKGGGKADAWEGAA